MDITDLNPGDLIKIKNVDFDYMEELRDIDVPVYCIKINDSFPSAIVKWTHNGRVFSRGFMGRDLYFVKQFGVNDKRWSWIAERQNIGDNYSIYNSPIAKDDRYKYLWQRWESDNYYHCPFCDKKLNKQEDIESGEDVEVHECDCEGWNNRTKLYNKMLKAQDKVKSLKNQILDGTRLGKYD